MVFLRFLMLLLIVQTVVYVCLLLYLRAAWRERLLAQYPPDATEREREAFIDVGLRTYGRWLAPRLALGVYLVPILVLVFYVLLSNS